MGYLALVAAGQVEPEAIEIARTRLGAVLGLETVRLAPLPDPAYAYDARRRQYSSTLVLRDALGRRPAGASRLLVVTEHDIFIPMLSFVYGQAQLGGPVAVVSLARLRQEFYGLPPNRPLFMVRVAKEALHEIGHTFGLTHCEEPLCTMRLSTGIGQLDGKGSEYCSSCAILVREAVAAAQDATDAGDLSGGAT